MKTARIPHAIAAAAVAAALVLAVWVPEGISPRTAHAGALCLVTIAFFATGIIPEHLTALGFFAIAMLFGIAPPGVAFAGFQSSALWLVVGGLFIGMGVQQTGLGDRIAGGLTRLLGGSYFRVIAGLVTASFALMILMPSVMGRVLILLPLAMALAERLGFEAGSKGRTGMVLAVAFGSFMTAGAVLPSNIANMILAGAAETLHGVTFTYGAYMFAHLPATGIGKAILILFVCWWFFREPVAAGPEAGGHRPWTAAERRMAAILTGALLIWVTDFLHGIDPGWVGLGAGVLCLMPGVGVLGAKAANEDLQLGPVFYTAGIIGFGQVLAWSGAGDILGRVLMDIVPFEAGADARNFGLLAVVTSLLGLVTNQLGVPAVMPPLATEIVNATGLPLRTVLMTVVVGYSALLLPYQTAPMVVALRISGVRFATAGRMTLLLALLTLIFLLPLNYVWWRLIGLFG